MRALIVTMVILLLGVTQSWGVVWLNTSFDCPEWTTADPLTCSPLEKSSDSTLSGQRSQITSGANNPLGVGRGFRQWVGDGPYPAQNVQTKPLTWDYLGGGVVPPMPEIWVRWYNRYESGFKWHPNTGDNKVIWLGTDSNMSLGTGNPAYIADFVPNRFYVWLQSTPVERPVSPVNGGGGFNAAYPGGISDGSWIALEMYVKLDTNGSNGVIRLWQNGVLVGEGLNLNLKNGLNIAGIYNMQFKVNQKYPDNINGPLARSYAYVDYDDIVIYDSAPPNTDASGNPFIGPIGWSSGSDTTPPTLNLPGLSPTANQTNVAQNAPVTIAFSEPVDCATVTTSTVTLTGSATGWTRTSCSGSTAVYQPAGQLPATTYTITVGGSTGVQDVAGNPMVLESYSYTTVADQTAPTRSGGAPSGVLPAGTTSTTLTVITNEPAGCRWGSAPGVSYPLQTAYFDATGGTTHTHQITGMRDGGSYTRYVRCNDQSGNTNNDDYVISWSVGSGGVGGVKVPLRAGAVKVGVGVGVTPLRQN